MEYVYTFLIGGAICVIGQILMDVTKLTAPRVLVQLAQSGAKVPLPGFGYTLAKGAMEGAKQGFLEAVTGGIKAAAGGISAAIAWGYMVALVFNPKSIR